MSIRIYLINILLFGGSLLCTLPTSASDYPYIGVVIRENVKLRAGYNKNFTPLKSFVKGEKVVVLDCYYNWFKVKLPDEVFCYVSKDFIDAYGNVKVDNLNVRAGPSTKYNSLGKLNKNDKVIVIDSVGNWYKIKPPSNCIGWVYKDYIKYYSDYRKYLKTKKQKSKTKEELDAYKQLNGIDYNNLKKYSLNELNQILNLLDTFMVKYPDSEYKNIVSKRSQKVKAYITENRVEKIKKEESKNNYLKVQGIIKELGNIIGNPASHKLVVGGQTKYYLKSDKVNLYDYTDYPVYIWGKKQKSNLRYPLITVDKIKYR